jgi:Holliday junction resolvase RusA-like endonuclease
MPWVGDNVLTFSMKGAPRGKGRPRFRVIGKGRNQFVQTYTDEATRRYEGSVAQLAAAEMVGRKPLEGPLGAVMRFRIPIPVSTSKRARAAILAGEQVHLGAIDVDNAVKAILDAMNGIVFVDDKQIVRLFATKVAAEVPGVDVRIEAFSPQELE